jgi:hypothetical protein
MRVAAHNRLRRLSLGTQARRPSGRITWLGVDATVNGNSVADLLHADRDENNLAKESDVVAEPVDPSVRVANGQIDVDPGK